MTLDKTVKDLDLTEEGKRASIKSFGGEGGDLNDPFGTKL
jgi:hypothetical protein